MRKLILIGLILAIATSSWAQNETIIEEETPVYGESPKSVFIKPEKKKDEIKTIFGEVKTRGFYMGMDAQFIDYQDWQATGMNFRMGWIVNHTFSLGFNGGYYGSPFDYDNYYNEATALKSGYGGLTFEIAFLPKLPVHVTFPISIGFGGISHVIDYTSNTWYADEWDYYSEYRTLDSDIFAYVQPAAQLEFNVLKHLRMGIGLAYMQTTSISIDNIDKYPLNGPIGNFSLKIGKF